MIIPVDIHNAENHHSFAVIDFMPQVTVTESSGNTRQVDEFKIHKFVDDIDDVIVHDAHKAFLVSPCHVLLTKPSVESALRRGGTASKPSGRFMEYDQAVAAIGDASTQEQHTRSTNRNAAAAAPRDTLLTVLAFDDSLALETKYFQSPSRINKIQHGFSPIQYRVSSGGVNTACVLHYRLSVVEQKDRIVDEAPTNEKSDSDKLSEYLRKMAVGGSHPNVAQPTGQAFQSFPNATQHPSPAFQSPPRPQSYSSGGMSPYGGNFGLQQPTFPAPTYQQQQFGGQYGIAQQPNVPPDLDRLFGTQQQPLVHEQQQQQAYAQEQQQQQAYAQEQQQQRAYAQQDGKKSGANQGML